MRRLWPASLGVSVAVAMSACGAVVTSPGAATQSDGGGSQQSVEPSVAPSAPGLELHSAATVSFSGKTDKKTTAFALGSPLKIEYTFGGSGNFIVDLNDTSGSTVASIANRIGPGSTTTWVYRGSGKAFFDVTANGSWTIRASTGVPPTAKVPLTLQGSTDVVTGPFTASGTLTVKWTTRGTGNFIVDLIDPTDGSTVDSVANLIGKSSDSTQLYGHEGVFAFDVTADGAWTLAVSSSP